MAEQEEQREASPEELLDAVRKMKVSDLLLSTVATTANLGYAKLEKDSRDLEQARLAVDSIKAILPVLEGHVAEEVLRDFNQLIASLQLAYVKAAEEKPEGDGDS
ncbi:MAG TPA: hypothetical protein VFL41_12700 [Gaiellaceae bacterium]|nr:hypothetical protein [Gaiellaceae bacterium]